MEAGALPGLDFQPDEMYVLQSPEELRALANPLRIQILDQLIDEPRTVRDVCGMLGINSTKLYYHVGELEKVGLVRLVHTEVQAVIQLKYYRAAASYYYVTAAVMHDSRLADGMTAKHEFLSSLVETTAHQLRRSVIDGTIDANSDAFIVSRRTVHISAEQARHLRDRLAEIDREISELRSERGPLTVEFAIALFPESNVESSAASGSGDDEV
ncbi:MAG TPA: winged helix-turn-helix domain-containing protein [Thermomicrobiaceae bacterium]|nr:winged helix-turn-helix domain-containing protein [Thermomicrobiaceae bacterium]